MLSGDCKSVRETRKRRIWGKSVRETRKRGFYFLVLRLYPRRLVSEEVLGLNDSRRKDLEPEFLSLLSPSVCLILNQLSKDCTSLNKREYERRFIK
jgi:hypothetical protein